MILKYKDWSKLYEQKNSIGKRKFQVLIHKNNGSIIPEYGEFLDDFSIPLLYKIKETLHEYFDGLKEDLVISDLLFSIEGSKPRMQTIEITGKVKLKNNDSFFDDAINDLGLDNETDFVIHIDPADRYIPDISDDIPLINDPVYDIQCIDVSTRDHGNKYFKQSLPDVIYDFVYNRNEEISPKEILAESLTMLFRNYSANSPKNRFKHLVIGEKRDRSSIGWDAWSYRKALTPKEPNPAAMQFRVELLMGHEIDELLKDLFREYMLEHDFYRRVLEIEDKIKVRDYDPEI